MYYKIYRFIRKNILLFGLIVLLLSIFINIPIILNTHGRIYDDVKKIPKIDTAVLLGTNKYLMNKKLNAFYIYRINAAENILKTGKIKRLVISGSHDGGYDEAETMKNDLLKRGIKEDKIVLDKKGDRTRDSIENVIDLGYVKFLVISQKFHLERALFIASLKGADSIGYSAESPNSIYASRVYLREVFARIKLIFVDVIF